MSELKFSFLLCAQDKPARGACTLFRFEKRRLGQIILVKNSFVAFHNYITKATDCSVAYFYIFRIYQLL